MPENPIKPVGQLKPLTQDPIKPVGKLKPLTTQGNLYQDSIAGGIGSVSPFETERSVREKIDAIPDLDEHKKDILYDLAQRGASTEVISGAIGTLQGKAPEQWTNNYYVKDGVPVPLKRGERPPAGYDIASNFGSQKDADDDSWYTDLAKHAFNIAAGTIEHAADLGQLVYGAITDETALALNEMKNTAGQFRMPVKKHDEFYNSEGLDKVTWSATGIREMLDKERFNVTPDAVWGAFLTMGQSMGETMIPAGAIGKAIKGADWAVKTVNGAKQLTLAGKAASTGVGSLLTNLTETRAIGEAIGLEGRDLAMFEGPTTMAMAAIDVKMGIDARILNNVLFRKEKSAFITNLVKETLEKNGGKITKEAVEDAYKVTLANYPKVAAKFVGGTVRGMNAEGLEEATQTFLQNAGQQLWDHLSDAEKAKFGKRADSPYALGEYFSNYMMGFAGSMGTAAVAQKAKISEDAERSKTVFDHVKKGEASIKEFKRNVHLAYERGELDQEQYNDALTRVNAYKVFNDITGKFNLEENKKRQVFELAFQKQNYESQLEAMGDPNKLHSLQKAEYNSTKKLADDLQKDIDTMITDARIKQEAIVAKKTLKDAAKRDIAEKEDGKKVGKDGKKKPALPAHLQALKDRFGLRVPAGQTEAKTEVTPLKYSEMPTLKYNDPYFNSRDKHWITGEHLESLPEKRMDAQIVEREFKDKKSGKTNSVLEVQMPDGKQIRLASSMKRALWGRGWAEIGNKPRSLMTQDENGYWHIDLRKVVGAKVGMKAVTVTDETGAPAKDKKGRTRRGIKLFSTAPGEDYGKFIAWIKESHGGNAGYTDAQKVQFEEEEKRIEPPTSAATAPAAPNQPQPGAPAAPIPPQEELEQQALELQPSGEEVVEAINGQQEQAPAPQEGTPGRQEAPAGNNNQVVRETDRESEKRQAKEAFKRRVVALLNKIKAYNAIPFREKLDYNELLAEITREAKEIGHHINVKQKRLLELINKKGKKVTGPKAPTRSLTTRQREAEEKAFQKRALNAEPVNVRHAVVMDIANGVRFDLQQLIQLGGFKAKKEWSDAEKKEIWVKPDEVPSLLVQNKGGVKFEFYANRMNEMQGINNAEPLDEDTVMQEAVEVVSEYCFKGFRQAAIEEAKDTLYRLENNGMSKEEVEALEAAQRAEEERQGLKKADDEGVPDGVGEYIDWLEYLTEEEIEEIAEEQELFDEWIDVTQSGDKQKFIDFQIKMLHQTNGYDPEYDAFYQKYLGDMYDTMKAKNLVLQKKSQFTNQNIQKVIDVIQKAMPMVNIVFDPKLKAAGQLRGNDLVINPYFAGKDTPIHEAGHILIDALGYGNKVIQAAIKQLQGTDLWRETADRYPELDERGLNIEVLAEAIGREGEGIFENETQKSNFRQWVEYIFDRIKQILGVDRNVAKSLAKRIIGGKFTQEMKGVDNMVQLQLPSGERVNGMEVMPEVINGFYSKLEKTLGQMKVDKLPAKQWNDKLRGEEAKWTGLNDWLAEKGQQAVTKQEIKTFLKDNRISVVEVVKGNNITGKTQAEIEEEFGKRGLSIGVDMSGEIIVEDEDGEIVEDIPGDLKPLLEDYAVKTNPDEYSVTKYHQYQLPGEAKNYREILITLPSSTKPWEVFDPKTGKTIVSFENKEEAERETEWRNSHGENVDFDHRQKPGGSANRFKSSHWEEPNILVHLRMNERTDSEGKKVLFLEEVQSDWGQKGKREGFEIQLGNGDQYRSQIEKEIVGVKEIFVKDGQVFFKDDEGEVFSGNIENGKVVDIAVIDDRSQYFDDVVTASKGIGVPRAPFVTDTNTWTKLGLKFALRAAVEAGADKVAWTTGEQQNERYDLSKVIKAIAARQEGEAASDGAPMYALNIFYKNGESNLADSYRSEELEGVVGKELAEKIIKDTNGKKEPVIYKELDLKVGGKGMKGFYDNIVPSVAKSLIKELTGKSAEINEVKIPVMKPGKEVQGKPVWDEVAEDGSALTKQQSIDITPDLVKAVSQGLPLFQKQSAELAMAIADVNKTEKDFKAIQKELKAKYKELGQTYQEDQEDLFGERQSQAQPNLFDERVDADATADVIQPILQRLKGAGQKVEAAKNRLAAIQARGESGTQSALFQKKDHKFNLYRSEVLGRDLEEEQATIDFIEETLDGDEELTEEDIDILESAREGIMETIAEDKEAYQRYQANKGKASKIMEDGADSFELEELISLYNELTDEEESTREVRQTIADHIYQNQIKVLSKVDPEIEEKVNKGDMSWIESWFKNLNDVSHLHPLLQGLNKMFDEKHLSKVREANERKKKLHKLGKAVIKEKNSLLGLVSDAFSSNNAKYFDFVEEDGALRTSTAGLTNAQREFLEFYTELVQERQELMADGEVLDNGLIMTDRGVRETFFAKREDGGGFLAAANVFLGGNNNASAEITWTHPETGRTKTSTYLDAQKEIIEYGQRGHSAAALWNLLKIAYKAAKHERHINYKGQLRSKYSESHDKFHSKDFFKAAMEFVDESAHLKHMKDLVPVVESIEMFYHQLGVDQGKQYSNTERFIREWKTNKLYHGKVGFDPIVDKSIAFLRHMTSVIVMAFNTTANLLNIAIGNYNTIRNDGLWSWGKGQARLFAGSRQVDREHGYGAVSKKAMDLVQKYDVISIDYDSNPRLWGGKLFDMIAHAGMRWGEVQIQSSQFLGKFSEEEWDSFEYDQDGNLVINPKGNFTAAELEERAITYRNEVSDVQGKYAEKDRRNFMNYEAWKAAGQFKVWIPDWWKMRFGKEFIDSRGNIRRGSWNMFTDRAIAELRADFDNYGAMMAFKGDTKATKGAMANLKGAMLVATLLIATHGDDDDDKRKKKLLSLENGLNNLLFVFDIDQLAWTIKQPFAIQGTVQKFIDVFKDVLEMDGEKLTKDVKRITPYNKLLDVPQTFEK